MDNQLLNNIRRFAGPSILVIIGSYMLHLSWFKWPDLLIDYGRELYVPWQILSGKVLYADINHLYGPFSHYFNALLFLIFGTGLSTLACFNIFLIILLTCIIYFLLRSSFGDFIATVACACFLIIFAFSQYTGISNYNFVCPYSHEVTYGIFLFFAALLIFKKYLNEQKFSHAALIGFILGLIFLTKVEIFIAGFLSMLFGLIFFFKYLKPSHRVKHLFCLTLFFLMPVLAFFVYFSVHMPFPGALDALTASYRNIFIDALAKNIYYLRMSGLDHPGLNLAVLFKQSFIYLSVFIFIGLTASLFDRLSKKGALYGVMIAIAALIILIAYFGFFPIRWLDIARPFPVFIILLIAFLIFDLLSKRHDKTHISQNLTFILLSIFSLLLLLKIILNVHIYHYGFALAMPASMVMVIILLHHIPGLISRWGNKTVTASFTGLLIVITILLYFSLTRHIYDMKNYPLAAGRDSLITFDPEHFNDGPVINKSLEYINKLMSPDDTFIVMPDGVMLNYLSRRQNPSRYFEFTPNFVAATGEDRILREISMHPPDFIILTKKDTSEHGAQHFGVNYAVNIYSWIAANYDKVAVIGEETLTGNDFGLIIARRKK